MSKSTTGESQHDRPCFCESCIDMTLEDLIDERAALLKAAFDDRQYEPWLETRLAEELIAAIPVASRAVALELMVTWDHLMPRVVAVDCLLDECDSRSYAAVTDMAAILLAAIHAQNGEGHALQTVVVNEICRRRGLLDSRLPV
jgi:hypothetical protein